MVPLNKTSSYGDRFLLLTATSFPSSPTEARIIFQIQIPTNPNFRFSRPPLGFPRFIIASSLTSQVKPEGVECKVVESDLPASIVSELLWAWESIKAATCCKSLVIVYNGICLIQIGTAESPEDNKAVIVNTDKLMQGSVYKGVIKSKAQSYLANLSLYPGRSELTFLPAYTQAVILQPLGDKGIAVIGGNTIRGFTSSDQAWISSIGEKLDATFGRYLIDSAEISQEIDRK